MLPTCPIPPEVLMRCERHGYTILRAWREHIGLACADMAQFVGVTEQDYSELESMPELAAVDRNYIAGLLGLNPSQLVA